MEGNHMNYKAKADNVSAKDITFGPKEEEQLKNAREERIRSGDYGCKTFVAFAEEGLIDPSNL